MPVALVCFRNGGVRLRGRERVRLVGGASRRRRKSRKAVPDADAGPRRDSRASQGGHGRDRRCGNGPRRPGRLPGNRQLRADRPGQRHGGCPGGVPRRQAGRIVRSGRRCVGARFVQARDRRRRTGETGRGSPRARSRLRSFGRHARRVPAVQNVLPRAAGRAVAVCESPADDARAVAERNGRKTPVGPVSPRLWTPACQSPTPPIPPCKSCIPARSSSTIPGRHGGISRRASGCSDTGRTIGATKSSAWRRTTRSRKSSRWRRRTRTASTPAPGAPRAAASSP